MTAITMNDRMCTAATGSEGDPHAGTATDTKRTRPAGGAGIVGFFSLTGGSLLYCLSALSIIYGIAKLLGPMLTESRTFGDAIPCLTALNVYEVALAGIVLFIVLWGRVTDDAVSLVILSALFLTGTGLALTTVSTNGWQAALVVGVLCLALGAGKLAAFKYGVGIPFQWGTVAVLIAILSWNFLSGPVLAFVARATGVVRDDWMVSWLFVLAAGIIFFIHEAVAAGDFQMTPGEVADKPFLHRHAMALLVGVILLIGAGVHQHAHAFVMDVEHAVGDYLPLLSVVSLVGILWSAGLRRRAGIPECVVAMVPLAAMLSVLGAGAVLPAPTFAAGFLWIPAALLALTGGGVLWLSVRMRSGKLAAVAGLYVLGVLLTQGVRPGLPTDLNWMSLAAVLAAGVFVLGLVRGSILLCTLAVTVAPFCLPLADGTGAMLGTLSVGMPGALCGVFGAGVLLVAVIFRDGTPVELTTLGALAFTAFAFDFVGAGGSTQEFLALAAHVLIASLVYVRTRQIPPLAILLLPTVHWLWTLWRTWSEWRYVGLSFLLLFGGAAASLLKGARARSS